MSILLATPILSGNYALSSMRGPSFCRPRHWLVRLEMGVELLSRKLRVKESSWSPKRCPVLPLETARCVRKLAGPGTLLRRSAENGER